MKRMTDQSLFTGLPSLSVFILFEKGISNKCEFFIQNTICKVCNNVL